MYTFFVLKGSVFDNSLVDRFQWHFFLLLLSDLNNISFYEPLLFLVLIIFHILIENRMIPLIFRLYLFFLTSLQAFLYGFS